MTTTEKPWYPDDRPWREHDGGACPIGRYDWCEVLRYSEREEKRYDNVVWRADAWCWPNVVAYLTKADSDAWEAAQKAKATRDGALDELARLGQEFDADRPLAVGDLVRHVAPGSPIMRLSRTAIVNGNIRAEWFTTTGTYEWLEAVPANFVRVER